MIKDEFEVNQKMREAIVQMLSAISTEAFMAGHERGAWEQNHELNPGWEGPEVPDLDEYINGLEQRPMIKAYIMGEFG